MSITDYLSEFISAVAGGGIMQLFNIWQSKKQEGRNDFEALIEKYKEDNDRLRAEMKEMQAKMKKIESRLMFMQSVHTDLPLAAWVKDKEGHMISFNKPYADLFISPLGKNPQDYLGSTDAEFWGEEVGNVYRKNDIKLYNKGGSELVHEPVIQVDGTTVTWLILKYVAYNGTNRIGIAGVALKEIDG